MEKLQTLGGEVLDAFHYVFRCSLNVIYDVTMGMRINSLINLDCKLDKSIECYTGIETSATNISFVLLMLVITFSNIQKKKLLERVIKETLRLFPPVLLIARKVMQDIKITKNWTIPKGCSAVFPIYKLHRSAKYWPRPLLFDPDRFLPEKNYSTYFFPFSYGRRNCIEFNNCTIILNQF
ncbi:cytochrome P450 4p1-like [Vespa velutina]|uniref:cytochrome P450 4p1-like n=1 Tax=Vespa velutina TaxID=202808 RepID=UPI001FB28378|nr:cytochrome P450 4p1-like [Vespa velutina]